MIIDVNQWKLKVGDLIIGQVLRCERGREGIRIFTKSLGGRVFIQTVGDPLDYIDADILCSPLERDYLNEYVTLGEFFKLTYRDETYGGYIEGDPSWETIYPGEWYKATIKLVRQPETA